jgi:hypothetical protein
MGILPITYRNRLKDCIPVFQTGSGMKSQVTKCLLFWNATTNHALKIIGNRNSLQDVKWFPFSLKILCALLVSAVNSIGKYIRYFRVVVNITGKLLLFRYNGHLLEESI